MMEIEQSFTVPYPRASVWACFHDAQGVVGCLPGASLLAPPEGGLLKLAMAVKLGPIAAAFSGDGEMRLDEDTFRGSVSGGGVDRKSASRVKGVAAFALEAVAPDQTRVDVKVDYTIAGSLAQFSRGGLVKDLATRMTEAFAANLKARLDDSAAAAVPAEAAPVSVAAAVAEAQPAGNAAPDLTPAPAARQQPPVNAPLNLGNLFWKILWARLRGLFGMGSR
ncbi:MULTISPECIES: SRPBCC family protein [Cupriavidus]